MCVHPLTIYRPAINGGVKEYIVPCGKCSECLQKLRNEVAALACLEGSDKMSLSFMTMTYSQHNLPISVIDHRSYVDFDSGELLLENYVSGFMRGYDCLASLLDSFKVKCDVRTCDDGSMICPTLHRQDWKDHMKRFRRALDRSGVEKKFSMLCFGEYGDRRSRPHYHALFFGLSPQAEKIFTDLWQKYYGDCKTISVPRFNEDGSDAFMKVSKYISKYISKGSHLPEACKLGYIEKPRRLSSVRFGRSDLDIKKLRSFI